MLFDFTKCAVLADTPAAQTAAQLFCEEIAARTGVQMPIGDSGSPGFSFCLQSPSASESFSVAVSERGVQFTAHRLRGLIYAFGLFLRKADLQGTTAVLTQEIDGDYTPSKPIRGHQIGYRAINNTYDMWEEAQFRRYFLDLMLFGMNTYEGIPGSEADMAFPMQMSGDEMLCRTSAICKELDLDVSVWRPTSSKESDADVLRHVETCFAKMPKLDALFVPGSDPGDLEPQSLFCRCEKMYQALRKYHPDVQIWISAQTPHDDPQWGSAFMAEVQKRPAFLTGIIYGPNHAMPLEDLYRQTQGLYPIRFYPDVTHCVRCEYPVHFEANDWHYAFASAFGRESVCPRPIEYQHLHAVTAPYVCGSVSYSDGIHDDVNKVIFSGLDFDGTADAAEILREYARVFFCGCNAEKIAQLILQAEQNWVGDPAENNAIDDALTAWRALLNEQPVLQENFRFMMLLFKAECDALIRCRLQLETALLAQAKEKIFAGDIAAARQILQTPFPASYMDLRASIDAHAAALHRLIGMQLDVARFHGMQWERGCTLETIDRPITDRAYLLKKIQDGASAQQLRALLERCTVGKDEVYFSFALHGMGRLAPQEPDFYLNFQGDKPENDGTLPTSLLGVFDHHTFRCCCRVHPQKTYQLRVTYKEKSAQEKERLSLFVNGQQLFSGTPYGGQTDAAYAETFLPEGYVHVVYDLPQALTQSGSVSIRITDPDCVLITEFFITESNGD